MKKKEKNKLKKMIRKEANKLSKVIVDEGAKTRLKELSHHRTMIQTLEFDYNQIMKRLYEYQSGNTQKILSDKCRLTTQPVAELKEFPDTISKDDMKKSSKKLQRQLKAYIDSELFNMCGALMRYFEEQINVLCNDKSKDKSDIIPCCGSVTKVGTLEDFEEFCKNVLNIPPEFILGPNYKDKMASKNDSDDQPNDKSSDKTDEKDKVEKDNKDNCDHNGHIYDCGTKNLVCIYVANDDVLHNLENRWYREDPNEPLKVIHYEDCKHLIGKEIWIRSSVTCECKDNGPCMICAGVEGIDAHKEDDSPSHDIGDSDIDDDPEEDDENIPAEHHNPDDEDTDDDD